jgi:GDP-mannose 6-dehydrogenase
MGVAAPLLDAVLVANAEQINRAERMIKASGATSVGLVGISFKPGTDDMRESPLAELAARLIGQGMALSVYDPFVHEAYANDMSAAGRGNDYNIDLKDRLVPTISELLAKSDIVLVGNKYDETLDELHAASALQPVIDLTRIKAEMRTGGRYQGICW